MEDFYNRCVYETETKTGKNAGLLKTTRPTKKVVEALILAGAFDTIGDRRQLFSDYYAAKGGANMGNLSEDEFEVLEAEMIGICLSKPPLSERYQEVIKHHKWTTIGNHENYDKVTLFGRIDMIEQKNSKAGNPMYIVRMSDGMDNIDFFVFMGGMTTFRDNVRKGDLAAIPLKKFQDSYTRFFDEDREIYIIDEDEETENG